MAKTNTVEEKAPSPLDRLMSFLPGRGESLEKALPPRKRDDDDEDEDDEGAPSQEDREKAAAPKAPVQQDDGSPDGDQDDDDDDAVPDRDATDESDDDDSRGDDDEQDDDRQPPAPMPKKKMPAMRKALEDAGDDDFLAEVRRRAQDSPDFLKGLLDGDNAAEILDAIDMSAVVAQIVQQASDTIAAKDIQIAALTKSIEALGANQGELVKSLDAIMLGIAKSLENDQILTKSMSTVSGEVELIKGQDSGTVSHGQGVLVAPKREDPVQDSSDEVGPDALPEGMNSGKIQRGLMKSFEAGKLDKVTVDKHLGAVGTKVKDQRLWKRLPEEVREIIVATK